MVFIKCPENAQPVEIVSKIFHDYKEYGTRKARLLFVISSTSWIVTTNYFSIIIKKRFISRIIPIQAICSPRVDSVVSSMRPLIQDHFPQSTQKVKNISLSSISLYLKRGIFLLLLLYPCFFSVEVCHCDKKTSSRWF